MSSHADALSTLRRHGCRLTPQRLLILLAVAEGRGHMPVDEVHRRAKESYPYMDVATVYRTLDLFKRLGVVMEVGIGDRRHFELAGQADRHYHMVCRACRRAFDLGPPYLDEFRGTLVKEYGFEPDLDHFTVSGICSECSKGQESGQPDVSQL